MNRGFDKETPLQKVYSLFVFWDKCKYKVCMNWNGYEMDIIQINVLGIS